MLCQKNRELKSGILQQLAGKAGRAAQMSRSSMRILCVRDTSHGQGSDAEAVEVKHGSYDGAEKYGLGLVADSQHIFALISPMSCPVLL